MSSEQKKQGSKFSISQIARARWNVLDLINVCNKGSVPTLLLCDVDMTWAEHVRAQLKEQGVKTTVTAILLKAIAIAQRTHPESRTVRLPWGREVTLADIVAGFTCERLVGSQAAVFFGAIENADTKDLAEIAQELKEYANSDFSQVRQLKLQNRFNNMPWLLRRFILWAGENFPPFRLKYMPATFGLSSLGKFGIRVLVPPCVTTSTFGVGAVEQRAVVRDGQIEIRPMMTIALNFDHRILDGAPAARFLQDVRRLLEGGLEGYLTNELPQGTIKLDSVPALT
ncbi:MAG: 2-oxo acid dehydrogenase subunit E2 [Candidatus Obscuribacterales bacterium]|nr:2-oxo acid dehydrogenase subunit E2 [Candidatus Obscuribacterales bacterium]